MEISLNLVPTLEMLITKGNIRFMARGIALTIGLNSVDPKHYAGWSGELNACEADAEDMASIATA